MILSPKGWVNLSNSDEGKHERDDVFFITQGSMNQSEAFQQ